MVEAMHENPDPTRTGAVWVAGTGAFLILSAAAVFVAVRWDQIPDALKLAAVVALSGVCLQTGYRTRSALPGTSGALWHLGALLVPVDVAALAIHSGAGWESTLLVAGAICLPSFALLARVRPSTVLEAGVAVAGLALAGGLGALTPLPAPVALATLGAGAEAARQHRRALRWALVAGFAPLLALGELAVMPGGGALGRLGLSGQQPRLTAVLAGGVAAVLIGRAAQRRADVGLGLVAVAAACLGTITSLAGIDGSARYVSVGLASLVLCAEIAAVLLDRDGFWSHPARIIAGFAESASLLATPVVIALLSAAASERFVGTSPVDAAALAVLAAALVVASERRSGLSWTTLGAALTAAASVELGTGEALAVAAALGAGAVGLAWSATRPSAQPSGQLDARLGEQRGAQVAFALASVGSLAHAVIVAGITGQALVAAVALAWVLAAILDRADLGVLPRAASALAIAAAVSLPPRDALGVALMVMALGVIDAVRLDNPDIGLLAAVALPVATAEGAAAAGLDPAATGLSLAVVASIVTFICLLLEDRWRMPLVAGAGLCWGSGIMLAATDKATFGSAMLLLGASAMAVGVALERVEILAMGGVSATVGMWAHLAAASVTASEPYLAPACVLLLALGVSLERRGASSWDAYAAPIVALGGAGLIERLAGGPAWHALLAGAVGVAAVLAGGLRRLAAPLLLGTILLVALTAHETLGLTAGVPTWAWLALAGALLLGSGIAMERRELGPVETGRRLVDVLHENFG